MESNNECQKDTEKNTKTLNEKASEVDDVRKGGRIVYFESTP